MNCANCKYNDGLVYTSIPAQYRCTITNEYHIGGYNCDVEFAPVRHGRWEKGRCSVCGFDWHDIQYEKTKVNRSPYCPNCGASMIAEEK